MVASAVLVTRPAGQAAPLCRALGERGLQAFHQPLIELHPLPAPGPAERQVLQDLDLYRHVIFISGNAVGCGVPWLADYWPQWPVGLNWYAVGGSTARALADWGIRAQLPLEEMTSEGLLRLPGLKDLHGQRVLIVKGAGGRDLLREELQRRGARVDLLVCYRRSPVELPEGELARRLRNWQIGLVMLSSGEGLHNLLDLLGPKGRARLATVTLVVPSPRVAAMAQAVACRRVLVADNASDDAMLRAVEQWQRDAGDK